MTAVLTRPRVEVHQPRERAVPCRRCGRSTIEVHAVCTSCGPDTCRACAPDDGSASAKLLAATTWFLLCLGVALVVPGLVVVLAVVLLVVIFDLTVVPHRRGWWS